ncbi:two-component system, OmpR family, sensor histidine kinase TorS [Acidovorax soli]|uniref:Virulence sensor protein BvgS n=3 Tax=Acidovorax soli TaxID=592050 RepID=A0A1H4E9M7_9BURK|nr:two-component system, OmpR family, sensor histidine kinase TorS [Acidovorax soli]
MMLPWIKRLDRRLGLIGKIGLALAVGALLTAAVAATAWLSFNQVVGLQRRIIDNTVPALEAVGAVTQLNNRTLALVDQLRLAQTVDEVDAFQRQGDAQLVQVRNLLGRLEQQDFEPQLEQALAVTVQEMHTNLGLQASKARQSQQVQAEIRQAQQALHRAVAELMLLAEALAANASTYSTATVSRLYPMVERGASRDEILASLDRLIEVDIDRMERMSELQLVCFRLKTTLDRVEGDLTPPALGGLNREFAADLAILSHRLQDFRDPTRKATAQRHFDVLKAALAPQGLFFLQARRQALGGQLAAERDAGAALALRLNEQGAALLLASQQAMAQVGTGSRTAIARGAVGFLAVAGVLTLSLLATLWLILRYELLGRLKGMESAMRALMAGDHSVAITHPVARHDPLLPLVQALEQFREHAIERQRLENSLRLHQQQLEQQVQDRTAALSRSNELLEREVALHAQARSEAEEANRAKNEFLGSLSHELRTPLSGVSGSAHLLRDTALDDRQREYLRMIEYANGTLLETLEDMLGFSRLEAGKLEITREPFAVRDVIDDMLALQSVAVRSKGLALVRDIADDVPEWLLGDRRKLNQILLNTIGNAIKFTDEGEVTVKVVRAADNPTGAVRLQFQVLDTGIGIPTDQQEAVFKPFVQVEDTAHRRHGGTGLGLAICQRLVELMAGRLWLKSTVGEGTEVGFELPFEPVAAGTSLAPRPDIADPIPSLDVLVVEDDDINRIVCQRYLEALGHRVRLAASGPTAIDLLRHGGHTDCMLMDISLPGDSGLEVAQTLRTLDGGRWRALPILGMSAHVTPDILEHPAAANMVGFLSKPFQRGELARALARALQASSSPTGASTSTPLIKDVAAAGDAPTLDEAYLTQEREDLGLDVLRQLLGLFRQISEASAASLQDAEQAADAEQIRRTAHQLRSAASNLGLLRVMQACRRLEDAVGEGMLTTAQRVLLISQLLEAIPEGIEALERWLPPTGEGRQDAALSASR